VVTLTDKAAAKLQELMAERGQTDEGSLRIYVKPGGCSGFSYGMALDSRQTSDLEYEVKGIQVLVDRDSLELVTGAEVDYLDDELTGEGFRIVNPNAVSTCGCGSSFRTAEHAGQPGSCE